MKGDIKDGRLLEGFFRFLFSKEEERVNRNVLFVRIELETTILDI